MRLTKPIESRGLRVFTRMDHAVAAREAGLDLADEQVLPFGNPRAGTPLSVGVEPKASDWARAVSDQVCGKAMTSAPAARPEP